MPQPYSFVRVLLAAFVLVFVGFGSAYGHLASSSDSLRTIITVGGSSSSTVTVCASGATLTATVQHINGTAYTGGVQWQTLGSGNFSDDTALPTVYTPSAADIAAGQVRLILQPACNCPAAADTVRLLFYPQTTLLNITGVSTTTCNTAQCNGKLVLALGGGAAAVAPYNIVYRLLGTPFVTAFSVVPNSAGQLTINGLCSGNYLVSTITDANGCTVTGANGASGGLNTSVFIDKPQIPTLTALAVQLAGSSSCSSCNGSLTFNLASGAAPFMVAFDSSGVGVVRHGLGYTTNNKVVLTGLCGSTLTNVLLTDANSCTLTLQTGPFPIPSPAAPLIAQAGLSVFGTSSCGLCDGKIILPLNPAQFGTPPYTVQLLVGGLPPAVTQAGLMANSNNNVVLSGLCAGSYQHIVLTDSHGCTLQTPAVLNTAVPAPPPLVVKNVVVSGNSCAANGGIVKIILDTMQLGSPSYRIVLKYHTNSNADSVVFLLQTATAGVITLYNVAPYNYTTITVKDSKGCTSTITGSWQIFPPLALALHHTGCFPQNSLSSEVVGSVNVQYHWSSGAQGMQITPAPIGHYTLTITDAATGCSRIATTTVAACPDTLRLTVRTASQTHICVHTTDLQPPFTTTALPTPPTLGMASVVSPDTCLMYQAAATVGHDKLQYTRCRADGFCDTTTVLITTIARPETIRDTIGLNDKIRYCPDATELGNAVDNTYFIRRTNNHVLGYQVVGKCLEAVAQKVGSDSIAVVQCRADGFCDTTYYKLITTPHTVATNDTSHFDTHHASTLDLLTNDHYTGNLTVPVRVLDTEIQGTLIINSDGKVTFTPYSDFCGTTTFRYVICAKSGCDTARVTITVACVIKRNFAIYNLLTPNGDGINDAFYIENIEDYPNSVLTIINRWGNQVYQAHNYHNDWEGTWDNKALPDGTYFYFLELNDTEGRKFSGYVELLR